MPVAELRLTLSLSLEPTLWVRGHQSIYLFGYTAGHLRTPPPKAVATTGQAILPVMISQRPGVVTHASDPSTPLGEPGG